MKPRTIISGFFCNSLGHKYVVTHTITNQIKEYRCVRCGKEVASNLKGKLEVITDKQRKAHRALQSFIKKKIIRKKHHYSHETNSM